MPDTWLIRDLPKSERPRERLLEQGSSALSDAELIAVLLRNGYRKTSAVQIARELLDEKGGLAGLLGATPQMLRRPGVGLAKAAGLLAALEIARRLARTEVAERETLSRPSEVARYLHLRYQTRDQEVMGALFLDGRDRMLGDRELYRGTLDRALVEPREVLKECLLRGAAGVILFHTHPSGDPTPSAEDRTVTLRMAEAAKVIGVRLVDHLVLAGTGRWVSLREQVAW
ncbi:MAG TPA: DNA repair protein RadC [Thermoanaerobaculia bacterium]|nr:DNA repair protein RadC [Thermoanaerobaculia bacterium]